MFKKIKEILLGKNKEMIKKAIGEKVDISEAWIPKRFRGKFSVEEIRERSYDSLVHLREKENQKPGKIREAESKGERIKKNGYMPIVEILAGSKFFSPLYIRFQRRRWKNIDTGEEHYNEYEFHPEGMKVLHEFAEYLKKIDRREFNKLFRYWSRIRYLGEKDYEVVQRLPEWIRQR
jgi:hypothetical protein